MNTQPTNNTAPALLYLEASPRGARSPSRCRAPDAAVSEQTVAEAQTARDHLAGSRAA